MQAPRLLFGRTTLVFLGTLSSIDAQDFVDYAACSTGSQETPPVVTSGSSLGLVSLNLSTREVIVNGSYANLSSNQTQVHIHRGAIGSPGGIVLSLTGTGGTSGTFSGSGTLSAAEFSEMRNGLHYVNIHTTGSPNGELRGQIIQETDSTCPPELATDPVLLDAAGTSLFGPKIGSVREPFNLAIDCSNAVVPSIWSIELRGAKLAVPLISRFGFLSLTGPKLLGRTGVHAQDVRVMLPIDLTLPNDMALVGLTYHAQGFCGGFSPNGRTTNVLTQMIGF